LPEFAAQWFEEYVKPNNRYAERKNKQYVLASLVAFFGKIPVSQITSHHIEQYKAAKVKEGLSNKTIRNHLTILRKCLTTAYEWLELKGSPPSIKWPKCAPPRTDYLSSDECALLLSHARGAGYELILSALRTGMRQGELRGLQWDSIDWENRLIVVRHSRCDYTKTLNAPKSNRERHIPLDSEVHALLLGRKRDKGYVFTHAKGQPFDRSRLHQLLRDVCDAAGLRKIGWHTLRHTFASHLVMKGVPLPAVQQLLGHTTIVMTMRYAHVAPSVLREAIEVLDPKMPKSHFGQPVGKQWAEAA
jgi:integrase